MLAYLRFLAVDFSTPLGMAFLGLIFGSFINMLAYRLPLMLEREWWAGAIDQLRDREGWRSIVSGDMPVDARQLDAASTRLAAVPPITLSSPSSCPHCGHVIVWYENIPVLSWLLLRGKCSACANPISWFYPMGEAICGLACFAFALQVQGSVLAPHALTWVVFVSLLMASAQVDLRTMLLPDILTMPLLWAGILFAALGVGPVSIDASLTGVVCGYAALYAICWGFAQVTGKIGMGGGDVKLFSALGAWLGAPSLLVVAFIAASCSVLLALVRGRAVDQRAPFGPLLALAGCITALINPLLLGWIR